MAPLIEARDVSKTYASGTRWSRGGRHRMAALEQVSLRLAERARLGLVGESGSGKSTLARILVGLEAPSAGEVRVEGHPTTRFSRADWLGFWRRVQYVFQDPLSALNPRQSVEDIIAAPLATLFGLARAARTRRVATLLDQVGLSERLRDRYPHELSGGQAQRVAIARAIAVEPEALILDEPVSALDVSVQAQVITLLQALSRDLGLAFLFISHDLAVVERLCSEVAVIKDGRIVERGHRDAVFGAPQSAYTRALLDAARRPAG